MKNEHLVGIGIAVLLTLGASVGSYFGATKQTATQPIVVNAPPVNVSNITQPATQSVQPDKEVGAVAYDKQYFQDVDIAKSVNVRGATSLGGTVEAQTAVATSTLLASSICNDAYLSIAPVSTTPTVSLPTATNLFASCLGSVGQFRDLVYKSVNTSTILASSTGGYILNSSSLTVAANKGALLRFIRDSATTYLVILINAVN